MCANIGYIRKAKGGVYGPKRTLASRNELEVDERWRRTFSASSGDYRAVGQCESSAIMRAKKERKDD